MYLETMQQIYSSTSKVMLDVKSSGNMLYLPIDKLNNGMDQGTLKVQAAQPNTSATQSVAGEPIQNVEVRSVKEGRTRDSRDNRDREAR